jgi:uncharacterized protein YqfA (UPF0365 family)
MEDSLMARKHFNQPTLNSAQSQEADEIFQRIQGAFAEEARRMAELMAAKDTAQLLGQTEFELRDRVHELGATVVEAAAKVRLKKGGLSRS